MSARRGFVTGGCWCVDRNSEIDFWPGEDMAAHVRATELAGGGSACNFALDMRRLDPSMPVETMGLVGDDDHGRFLAAQADAGGIDRRRLRTTVEAPTQLTDAFHSLATGRRTHIIHEGAGALLSPDHFDFSGLSGRIFHLGLPGIHRTMDAPWKDEPNGWVDVLKRARAAGLATNLELVTVAPARLRALALPCLPHLDTLVVNDREIGAIAGVETIRDGGTDADACRRAVRRALDLGAMDVVVAHHEKGAELAARDGTILSISSVNVPESAHRGANGAGDAFAAGFLYGRHEGWTHEASLRLAHAAAAASLRSPTTSGGVESVGECLALAENWGWRSPV